MVMPAIQLGLTWNPEESVLSKRIFNNVLADSYYVTGKYWFEKMLPKHYTVAGGQKYGYRARGKGKPRQTKSGKWITVAGYETRKMKKFGHKDPLVYSGRMRDQIRAQPDVRSTSKGARIVLHGPEYLRHATVKVGQPNKGQELTAITHDEIQVLQGVMMDAVRKGLSESKRVTSALAGHRVSMMAEA